MSIAFDIAELIKNQPVSNGGSWMLIASPAQAYRSIADRISEHLINHDHWTFEECRTHVFNALNPEKAFLSCAVNIDGLFGKIDKLKTGLPKQVSRAMI